MAISDSECSPTHIFVVSSRNFVFAFSGFKSEGNTLACFITPPFLTIFNQNFDINVSKLCILKKYIKEQV